MAKAEIGKIACQCCGEPASVREQKNGRSYVMCNSPVCGFQGFTRSADADKNLRGKMTTCQPETKIPVQNAPPAADQIPPQPPKKKGFFDDLANL